MSGGFVLTPPATNVESLVFDPDDPVDITDFTDYWVESFEYTPARPKTEWIESADADGGLPTNADYYTNAEATLRIRVAPQGNKDAALDVIDAVIQKGQKARRMVMQGERGLAVEWTPKGSERVGTLYLLECDDYNVVKNAQDDPGYFQGSPMPVFTVHLTFAPFVYTERVEVAEITSTDPVISYLIEDAEGDVRTPLRLTITDNASTARKRVEVGLERWNYNAADLWLDEADLTETTPSNSVVDADASGGNAIELNGLFPGWQDLATASGLTHEGTFRIKARVKSTADEEEVHLRLKWRVGTVPFTANALAVVAAFSTAAYTEVDLGTVTLPAQAATLDLIVQAKADVVTGGSEGVRLDALAIEPTERYTAVEGAEIVASGETLSWYDGFTHGSGGDTLIGTSPELGTGNWAEAGDADDWLLNPAVAGGYVTRLPSSADADLNTGQYATAGGTLVATTAELGVLALHRGGTGSGGKEVRVGGLVRYTDANNWLGVFVRVKRTGSGGFNRWLTLYKRVSGTVTKLKEVSLKQTALSSFGKNGVSGSLKISVTAAGVVTVYTGPSPQESPTAQTFTVSDSALATAGALDDGKVGIYHATDLGSLKGAGQVAFLAAYSTTASSVPTYAIPDEGRLEIDGSEATTYTAASGGTAAPAALLGSALLLEPAGSEDKTTRLSVKVRDNASGEESAGLTRSTKVKGSYEPAHLAFPGA